MRKARLLFFAFLLLLVPFAVLASEPVNINTADAQALAGSLKGVGLSKAEAIVAHREANGPFRSADDLLQVKGIGEKTLEANRDLIRVE